MLLTRDDAAEFFPELTLVANTLDIAIRNAQMAAESIQGANRKLEARSYTEVHKLPGSKSEFFVNLMPVLETPAPVVQIRRRAYSNFGRAIAPSNWITLSNEQYQFDRDRGKVELYFSPNYHTDSPALNFWQNTPDALPAEARIIYSSGFNPTATDEETIAIKQAIANIMTTQNPFSVGSSQMGGQSVLNIKSFELADEYAVEFSTESQAIARRAAFDASLQFLKNYQPRSFP